MKKFILSIFIVILSFDMAAGATGPTLNHCKFTWTDPETNLSLFNIYLGTASGGPYTKVGTFPASPAGGNYGPTGDMCGGQPNGQKFAVVKAVNLAGTEGAASNEVPFVYDTTVPGPATNLGVQ